MPVLCIQRHLCCGKSIEFFLTRQLAFSLTVPPAFFLAVCCPHFHWPCRKAFLRNQIIHTLKSSQQKRCNQQIRYKGKYSPFYFSFHMRSPLFFISTGYFMPTLFLTLKISFFWMSQLIRKSVHSVSIFAGYSGMYTVRKI